jgi:transposase
MGNVLKMDKRQQIQALVTLGWSSRAISKETGIDRDTVSKYRLISQNPPNVLTESEPILVENPPEEPTDSDVEIAIEAPPPSPDSLPSTNSAQLRPYVENVQQSFKKHLTAQLIYQNLVENHSYKGSYDSVKRYVRKLRKRHKHYCERLPHLPGREAQVDFGKSTSMVKTDGRYRRAWIFKMTLACSKHSYEEFIERQDLETFLRCHENAFAAFGGVPEIVTLDNVKAGVLLASIYEPILNQTYFAFANHWGFAANPCMPYRPDHKGVVERDIGYTKQNAAYGKKFESLEEANAALRFWNKRWARTRIHGTTKCQVWKLFCDLERPVLRPVADKQFEYFNAGKRRVDVNGLIEVESRYYGVPPKYVGMDVVVHFNKQNVKVLDNDTSELIIMHRTLLLKGKISSNPLCKPEWKHPNLESQERYYCQQARKCGPNMHNLVYTTLLSDDPLAIRRVRGQLSLIKKYGPVIVEDAAAQASRIPSQSYHILKNICEHIKNAPDCKPQTITQNHELIRSLNEYETIVNERTI